MTEACPARLVPPRPSQASGSRDASPLESGSGQGPFLEGATGLAARPPRPHKIPMPSPSYTQALLDEIRALPDDKIAEVADFVGFLRSRQRRAANSPEERLRIAADAGLIILPERGRERSSVTDAPPIAVPGRPLSECVLEERR